MGICIVVVMAPTLLPSAQLYSMIGRFVEHVFRLSVTPPKSLNGVCLETDRLSSLQSIFVHPVTPCPMTMEGGAMYPFSISTCHSLPSCRLLNTRPASYLFSTEGIYFIIYYHTFNEISWSDIELDLSIILKWMVLMESMQGSVQQKWRNTVHNKWARLL